MSILTLVLLGKIISGIGLALLPLLKEGVNLSLRQCCDLEFLIILILQPRQQGYCTLKTEYSFSKHITDRRSLRLHAMMPVRGEAESQKQMPDCNRRWC